MHTHPGSCPIWTPTHPYSETRSETLTEAHAHSYPCPVCDGLGQKHNDTGFLRGNEICTHCLGKGFLLRPGRVVELSDSTRDRDTEGLSRAVFARDGAIAEPGVARSGAQRRNRPETPDFEVDEYMAKYAPDYRFAPREKWLMVIEQAELERIGESLLESITDDPFDPDQAISELLSEAGL